jgi:hypothetical protein
MKPFWRTIVRHCRRGSLLAAGTVTLLITGCQKHDTTTVGWHPSSPVGINFTWSGDGLYKVSLGVPVAALGAPVGVDVPVQAAGVFTIEHEFDLRQDATYIIIRNRAKGIDQVFQVGVRGYVELDLSGEHKLLLHNEGENKFVIEDISLTPIHLQFFPQGEERATASIHGGPEFVFLTDHRLHIQYPSLSHFGLNGAGMLQSLIYHKDDAFSLDSVDSIVFKREYQVSQLIFNWKPQAANAEPPLVVELPRGGYPLVDEVLRFDQLVKTVKPEVSFEKAIAEPHLITRSMRIGFAVVTGLVVVILLATRRWVLPTLLIMVVMYSFVLGTVWLIKTTNDRAYWTLSP